MGLLCKHLLDLDTDKVFVIFNDRLYPRHDMNNHYVLLDAEYLQLEVKGNIIILILLFLLSIIKKKVHFAWGGQLG